MTSHFPNPDRSPTLQVNTRDAKDVETDSKANVAVAHWRKKGHLSLG